MLCFDVSLKLCCSQAVECTETFWELQVPAYHTKVRVYHIDALKMAGLVGTKGGQMAFGMYLLF